MLESLVSIGDSRFKKTQPLELTSLLIVLFCTDPLAIAPLEASWSILLREWLIVGVLRGPIKNGFATGDGGKYFVEEVNRKILLTKS